MQYDEITELDDESPAELQGFDIVIPVHHKKEPLAFALIKRPKTESYETIQEKISFIETYTNIIIVAIENKRLFQHQIEQERVKKELELAAQVQTLSLIHI